MVVVVNGVGYDSLIKDYRRGRIAKNTEINVALVGERFLGKLGGVVLGVVRSIVGLSYCKIPENLGCYFDKDGVLRSIDLREEISGDLEKSFGVWGALAANQSL